MRSKYILFLLITIVSGIFSTVSAQVSDGGLKPSVVLGDVTSMADAKIVLQTKDGSLDIVLNEKTEYKRVPPENPSLKNAVASALTEIGAGDKLAISGFYSDDKKTLRARTVFLMTKADITKTQSERAEQWRTRSINGKVKSINEQTGQITVGITGLMGTTNIVLSAKDNAKFKRFAPDSFEYSKAKPSSASEIKVDDTIIALGDKSSDGLSFAAEEIVSGAFQTVAGTVKSVDATKNEVIISDFRTKKDVVIVVTPTTLQKKFPEEFAQRFAMMQSGGMRPGGQGGQTGQAGQGGTRPPQGQNPQGGTAPTGQPNPNGQGGGFGGGMRGGQGGIDAMLERFPTISIADLKAGEMIAVSSTKAVNSEHLNAIKLLAGVEPFLKAQQTSGGGNQGGGGQGGGGGFTIPGLDGVSFP
ncbi:MAG TPA: hypothetical protein PKY59_05510 [Pyrinomonadaceae bacterium]|nr:hypothetical protein [Pyrinomonadaceae bacterium]